MPTTKREHLHQDQHFSSDLVLGCYTRMSADCIESPAEDINTIRKSSRGCFTNTRWFEIIEMKWCKLPSSPNSYLMMATRVDRLTIATYNSHIAI